MSEEDDPWLFIADAAEVANVAPGTWRAYVTRKQAPRHDRRDPESGRRQWRRSTIDTWKANRPGQGRRPKEKATSLGVSHDTVDGTV